MKPVGSWTKEDVTLLLVVLTTLVTLGLFTYQTIVGAAISPFLAALMGTLVTFVGSQLASAQGARQALTLPPMSLPIAQDVRLDSDGKPIPAQRTMP